MISGFRSLHPLPAFLYFAGVMLLAMLLLHPAFLAVSAVFLLLINVRYEPTGRMLRTLFLFLAFGLVLFVINPFVSQRGRHILFEWMDRPVTLEAVLYGLTMALSPLTIVLAFILYNRMVSHDKFLYLFASIWPKGSMITVMAMRFIPLFTRRLSQLTAVQQTKGVSLTSGPLRSRLSSGMKLLQILLTWSLEEALQTADSMKARGFGLGRRSTYAAYSLDRRDYFITAWILFTLLFCIGTRLTGMGMLTIYPRMESLAMPRMEQLQLLVYFLLIGTPLWVDGREWLRWRLSN